MIANGVASPVNLIPILVAVLLLGGAIVGGMLLKPAQRALVEKYLLRPLGILILAAGLFWAGHETWRDVAVKHDNLLAALHVGLALVIAWVLVALVRRTIRAFRPIAPTPGEGAP
ncbi:MAG: hypothetical protein JWP35_993 [Caulobacter sp.]|nr:hypothetical protein [Caulobacter sp.]